jgi:hypothetical protein
VVELELLERGEGAILLLRELQRALLESPRLIQAILCGIRLAQERKRDEQSASAREQGPDREGGRRHARAYARSSR